MTDALNDKIMGVSRREFFRRFLAGLPGIAVGNTMINGCSSNLQSTPKVQKNPFPESPDAQVALVTGTDRRQMIFETLKAFKEKIKKDIAGKKILIKINCNRPDVQLIKTHPDAVRGILDVITPMYGKTILVGEATSANVPTVETFSHFGYYALEKEYNVKIVEINDMPVTYQWILDRDLFPERICVHSIFLDPDVYLISVTPLKTHDTVIATLSLKNVVMGAPQRKYKSRMHGFGGHGTPSYPNTPKTLNLNMFKIAHSIRPDLAVLDGVVGAEGNGPNHCDPVDHQVALASTDFVAADRIGTELMGIPWEKMGYLQYCALAGFGQGERDRIHILGPDPRNLVIPYKLHDRAQWQLEWDKPVDWSLIHPKR